MTLSEAPGTPLTGYGAGLVLSAAAHVGVAALVVALLQPGPVTDQPLPKSELRIETQAVQQSQAKPQASEGQKAAAASAAGAAAAQGTVRQSQARPAALPQTVAKAEAPAAPAAVQTAGPAPVKAAALRAPAAAQTAAPAPVQALAPPAETVSAATPQAQPLAPTAPPAQVAAILAPPPPVEAIATPETDLTATAPAGATVLAAAPTAQTLTASAATGAVALAAAPATQTIAAASAPAQPLSATVPTGEVAGSATPQAETVAAAPATGEQMTATLAWSGAGAALDPVSLKAIASFMRPGDAAAQADDVHDGLAALLSAAPCSRLQAEFNPATGSLDLRGHVPDAAMKGPILAALQAQLGGGIPVNDALMILPRPQCGALSGIADVGLPQSQDQLTNPKLIGADAQARTFNYVQGQKMELELAAPDYDAFVYVDFFDADGNVIHLIPNDRVPLKARTANSTFFVGRKEGDEPALDITIGPPYGQEIAAAFAASAPLYDGVRPLSEPAGSYLEWLKTRVAEARAKDPGFKGEWVYFMVSTKAQ